MSVVVAGASAVGRQTAEEAVTPAGATAFRWDEEIDGEDAGGASRLALSPVQDRVRVDLRRLQAPVHIVPRVSVPMVGPGSTDLSEMRPVVSTAQLMLRDVDPTLLADGCAGPRTRAAILSFQRLHDRAPTGALGPDDWRLLCTRNTLAIGCTGHGVQACQWLLNHLPDVEPLEMDGVFGTGTYMVVRETQRRLRMVEDGVLDVGMWFRLLSPHG
ncbi:peptidoglycan-binding protein [Luteipulveratus sp. YIM 133132]|uniref:Peptidoglycan-binding protein n=1 Tax=Luteipulveratus flavus TaxID=3031728 RepID=A0ABT6C5N5_9MICO|nr:MULTISPECIES: peptidoglycan-binding protein [unclassified Luteipulveratus]MDE9366470.1 peptidoglycan-binding protein [Luteipulveratus sp. YIM 133132]MDF8264256.1 peptidoglycan-binding protein [Luteipulveratus sp. YIM 133296]